MLGEAIASSGARAQVIRRMQFVRPLPTVRGTNGQTAFDLPLRGIDLIFTP